MAAIANRITRVQHYASLLMDGEGNLRCRTLVLAAISSRPLMTGTSIDVGEL